MDPFSDLWTTTWGLDEPHHSQKRPSSSDDGESLQARDTAALLLYQTTEMSSVVVPNETNGSTAQASQPPSTSNPPVLRKSDSSLSEIERAQRKRKIDQKYREKRKKEKAQMQLDLKNFGEENEFLKKENLSLKNDNALINQTLRDQKEEIDQLRSDLLRLKRDLEKQNVLVETLSGLLADPVRLENERLRDENASLKKNANFNYMIQHLVEENANLKIENKVLKVQNDALCGKIISDNDKKCEQETADLVRLENGRLKDENALLKKNANLNSMIPQLVVENAKLKIENKVLKVQNDALCGKIISDNDKKCEQETVS